MAIGDWLYRLSTRDAAYPNPGFIYGKVSAAAAAAEISTTIAGWDLSKPPPGTLIHLTRVLIRAIPGAATNATEVRVALRSRAATSASADVLILDSGPGFADPTGFVQWSIGDHIAINPALFALIAIGNFSAATAVNNVELHWCSEVIPIGNFVQYGGTG